MIARPLHGWMRLTALSVVVQMVMLSVGPAIAEAAAVASGHAGPAVTASTNREQVTEPAPAQEPLTIGVLDLDANGVEDYEARAIAERLRIYLGRTQVFQVIERNQMENIMEEMGFQFSGACDTDECVVQVGRMLGASKMVAGSVSRVGINSFFGDRMVMS